MENAELLCISPIDGRYRSKVAELAPFYSEFALIRYRVRVEAEYLVALAKKVPQLANLDTDVQESLMNLFKVFNIKDAEQIKETEKTLNHDVKAVEYYLKEQLEKLGQKEFEEFVHFGLTSQDVNNTAIPLMLRDSLQQVIFPVVDQLQQQLVALADDWAELPMLAHTHGQPASPTRLGKEVNVFAYRLEQQLQLVKQCKLPAKFGGATGNLNAHYLAYPEVNWQQFATDFVEKQLGLSRSLFTTQIENYDHLAALFDALKRVCTVLVDLSRDFWQYISMGYLIQKVNAKEVGSSAMPHKVNPIDFENAEGNLGIAIALFEHLSSKLPVSRLQRDLTDSTVLRNIGVPISHLLIALKALEKGLGKISVNELQLHRDLENNWAVVAEGIQTILRREGYPKPYEALKNLTRTGKNIDKATIKAFIQQLRVTDGVKEELLRLTPHNYVGRNS